MWSLRLHVPLTSCTKLDQLLENRKKWIKKEGTIKKDVNPITGSENCVVYGVVTNAVAIRREFHNESSKLQFTQY